MADAPSAIQGGLLAGDYILVYATLIAVIALSVFYVVLQNFILSRKIISQLQSRSSHGNIHSLTEERSRIISILPRASKFSGPRFLDAVLSEYGVSITDKNGKILFVNEKFCRLCEFSELELIGSDHKIFNSNFHSKEFWSDMYSYIENGKVWSGDIRNQTKNGKYFWVNTIIFPLSILTGDEGFMTLRSDISQIKSRENSLLSEKEILVENLNQYNEKLKKISEEQLIVNNILKSSLSDNHSINDLYVRVIKQISNISWIPENNYIQLYIHIPEEGFVCQVTYSSDKYLELHNTDPHLTDDVALKSFLNINETGSEISYFKRESDIPKKNDHFSLVIPLLTQNSIGIIFGFIVIHIEEYLELTQDITAQASVVQTTVANVLEKEKNRSELNANRERLSLAFDSANLGFWQMNIQTGKTEFDKRWTRFMGYTSEELEHSVSAWMKKIHPDDIALVNERFSDCLSGKTPKFEVEHRILTKEGRWLWFKGSGKVTAWDQQGRPLVATGLYVDITDLKQYQQELEDANRHKSEFLTNMSHELRTPLNAIIGFSDALIAGIDGPINEQQRESLNFITSNGKHLLGIIGDILDIAKLDSGNLELYRENISINNHTSDIIKSLQPLAEAKNISIEMFFENNAEIIFSIDPLRYRQIITNLIGNAIKFTKKGSVTIHLDVVEDIHSVDPEHTSGLTRSEKYLKVSVKDTGIGIPYDKSKQVFEKFMQADTTTTREYGGTGLGLSIVKRFIESHGGVVWFDSVVGKGSCFTFLIPSV